MAAEHYPGPAKLNLPALRLACARDGETARAASRARAQHSGQLIVGERLLDQRSDQLVHLAVLTTHMVGKAER